MRRTVEVVIASGRGVAERWRDQYFRNGEWHKVTLGDSEQLYNRLCDLGPTPSPDQVADVLGVKGWAHITCTGCGEDVLKAVSVTSDRYNDNPPTLCRDCIVQALAAYDA